MKAELKGYGRALTKSVAGIFIEAGGLAVGQVLPSPLHIIGLGLFVVGAAVQMQGILDMVANLDYYSPQRAIRVY